MKHFKDDPTRVECVVDFLKEQKPNVFALYEVTGSAVFAKMTIAFPGHTFQIT